VTDDQQKNPVERALDVLVYAPLGLAAFARDTVPGVWQTLAARGRAEVEHQRGAAESRIGQAKTIGRFAIDYGAPVMRQKVEQRIGEARGRAEQTFSGLVVHRGGLEEHDTGGPDGEGLVVAQPDDVADVVVDIAQAESEPPEGAAETNGAAEDLAVVQGPADTAIDDAFHAALPIPDYDELSASQVVQRLPGLGADELEAIRAYEARGRGRRTILGKIDQLVR
jgi:hypothetical protein